MNLEQGQKIVEAVVLAAVSGLPGEEDESLAVQALAAAGLDHDPEAG